MTETSITPVAQAEQALTVAKAQLAEAQAAADREKRLKLVEELRGVRAELRQAEARYQFLRRFIYTAREQRGNAQAKVARALEALGDAEREKPEVTELLPSDPDVRRWLEAYGELRRKVDQAIDARDALPDPEGAEWREACTYEGAYGRIATLRFSEQNLLRALEGRSPNVRIEGGVFGVR